MGIKLQAALNFLNPKTHHSNDKYFQYFFINIKFC
jgi:hypothetical protein